MSLVLRGRVWGWSSCDAVDRAAAAEEGALSVFADTVVTLPCGRMAPTQGATGALGESVDGTLAEGASLQGVRRGAGMRRLAHAGASSSPAGRGAGGALWSG